MVALGIRLNKINNSLTAKYFTRNDYQEILDDSGNAFNKILGNSQILLHVLKRE